METYVDGCTFCRIVAGDEPATVLEGWADALVIQPLNPVTPGHALIIPTIHVRSAASLPYVAGTTAARAAEYAAASQRRARGVGFQGFNLITSAGVAATQTIWHLHWHFIPRRPGDGLMLPWTGQEVPDVSGLSAA